MNGDPAHVDGLVLYRSNLMVDVLGYLIIALIISYEYIVKYIMYFVMHRYSILGENGSKS